MTPALGAAGVGYVAEEIRQAAYLFSSEHDLGGSCDLKLRSVGVSQVRLRIAT